MFKLKYNRFLKMVVLATLIFGGLNGCTYVRSVSQTNVPAARNHLVKATVKKNIFLGFNFDNDEVFTLSEKLKSKCRGGQIKGILTEDKMILYFLNIFWARETVATGYCIKSKNLASKSDLPVEIF